MFSIAGARSAKSTTWRAMWWLAISCAIGWRLAIAAPPIALTKDQSTKLNLTGKKGALIDLLDCQLRVEGESPNFHLTHSKGILPIPVRAVKRMQDESTVEIAVRGKLFGLPLNRLWLPYLRQPTTEFSAWRGFSTSRENQVLSGNAFAFLIDAEMHVVAEALVREKGPDLVLRAGRIPEGVVVLLSHPDLPVAAGYRTEAWPIGRRVTEIQYQCAFGR